MSDNIKCGLKTTRQIVTSCAEVGKEHESDMAAQIRRSRRNHVIGYFAPHESNYKVKQKGGRGAYKDASTTVIVTDVVTLLLGLLCVILRCAGVIRWPWWAVTLPFWAGPILVCSAVLLQGVCAVLIDIVPPLGIGFCVSTIVRYVHKLDIRNFCARR